MGDGDQCESPAPRAHLCVRGAGLSRGRSPARGTVPITEEHRVPVPTALAGASDPARPVPTPVALDTLPPPRTSVSSAEQGSARKVVVQGLMSELGRLDLSQGSPTPRLCDQDNY